MRIILGMLKELAFTEGMKFTDPSVRTNLLDLLNQLSILVSGKYAADAKTVNHDKKVSGHKIMLPVVEKEGV